MERYNTGNNLKVQYRFYVEKQLDRDGLKNKR